MANDFVVHAPVQEAGYAAGFEPVHADAQVRRKCDYILSMFLAQWIVMHRV